MHVLPFVRRLWIAAALSLAAYSHVSLAQTAAPLAPAFRAPFGVGETQVYDVKFGFLTVGTARMEVVGIDTVRGRPSWHTKLQIDGGIPGYRVHDVLESWIEISTFNSLRHHQESVEGSRRGSRRFEIMPERGVYREDSKPELPTVAQPLDEGAFMFFVRTQPLVVGATFDFPRYFMPDRNPVRVVVDRQERVSVPAGTFETVAVRPVFKSKGIFSQNGRAEIWFTDDDRRLMVRMVTHVAFGTLSLSLREFTQGEDR